MNIDEFVKSMAIELKAWLEEVATTLMRGWEVPNYWASVGWHGAPGG